MNKKALIAVGVLVIIIAGAAFWLLRPAPETNESATSTADTATTEATTSPRSDESTGSAPDAQETVITYSDNGYSPSTITVKTGDTVTIKNTSSQSMMFDSDPHPAHTTNPELNVDTVPAGESKSFVVNRTGTFGYHNHLNAREKGTIIVE